MQNFQIWGYSYVIMTQCNQSSSCIGFENIFLNKEYLFGNVCLYIQNSLAKTAVSCKILNLRWS